LKLIPCAAAGVSGCFVGSSVVGGGVNTNGRYPERASMFFADSVASGFDLTARFVYFLLGLGEGFNGCVGEESLAWFVPANSATS